MNDIAFFMMLSLYKLTSYLRVLYTHTHTHKQLDTATNKSK